jgi:hypothetical protein
MFGLGSQTVLTAPLRFCCQIFFAVRAPDWLSLEEPAASLPLARSPLGTFHGSESGRT